MYLNKRIKELINILIENNDITLDDISSELQISNRMVLNYVKHLNLMLFSNFNLSKNTLLLKQNYYHIDENLNSKLRLLLNDDDLYIPSAEERINLIILQLLLNKKINLDEQYFSQSTINKDISKIKQIAKLNGYKVKSSNGSLVLSDDEVNQMKTRSLLLRNIWRNIDIYDFKEFASEKEAFKKVIYDVENELNINLIDSHFELITTFLAVTSKNYNYKMWIPDDEKLFIESTKAFRESGKILSELKKINPTVKEWCDEQFYITILLISLSTTGFENKLDINSKLNKKINQFLMNIANDYELETIKFFKDKEQLVSNISNHFVSTYYRTLYEIPLENVLLKDIKRKYGDSFNVVKKICERNQNILDIKIDDGEIAFLTLYLEGNMLSNSKTKRKINIGIVCQQGTHTSILLESEIRNIFSNKVNSIDSISIRDLNEKFNKYDLIVSTIDIEDRRDIVKVNTILSDLDMKKLKKNIDLKYDQIDASKDALEILTLENILIVSKKLSSKDSIKESFSYLIEEKIVSDKYVIESINRTINNPEQLVVSERIAIPHSRPEYGVSNLGLQVSIFKNKLCFTESKNKVQILLSIATPDNFSHRGVLKDMSKLIKNSNIQEKIINSNSKEEIYMLLHELWKK